MVLLSKLSIILQAFPWQQFESPESLVVACNTGCMHSRKEKKKKKEGDTSLAMLMKTLLQLQYILTTFLFLNF